jgi:hypothetical protein
LFVGVGEVDSSRMEAALEFVDADMSFAIDESG